MLEHAGEHRDFGDRHLVGDVSGRDIADVGDAGLRQLEHVGGLAELLRRIVLERHRIVGALLDLGHPRLEHEADEIVPFRKGVGDPQLDRFRRCRQIDRCDEEAVTG